MHRSEIELGFRCGEDWSTMQGDERRRHCASCARDVHDLSAVTRARALRLLGRPSPPCVRFRTDASGRLVFRPSRATRAWRWVAALLVGWSGPAWAEPPPAATVQPVYVAEEPYVGSLRVRTTFEDLPMEGVQVAVTSMDDDRGQILHTGPDGEVFVEGLGAGRYEVTVEQGGFQTAIVTDIVITSGRTVQQTVRLMPGAQEEIGLVTVPHRPGWRLRRLWYRIRHLGR